MPLNNVISLLNLSWRLGSPGTVWYSNPRASDTPCITGALKTGPLSLWTLEFKILLTSWEVSTVKFHPLVNLWALGINKTIVVITLKECVHNLFFIKKQTKAWSNGQAQSGSLQEKSLKSLKSLLRCWGSNQLISLGLLSFSYKFI